MKRSTLRMAETLKVKRGCYTMKDIEIVSSGKVKYNSLTVKSVIDSTISQFDPHMNKIPGIKKKYFHLKLTNCQPQITFNGKPSDVLYTGYLNKDISFGDIVYFEPKSIAHK